MSSTESEQVVQYQYYIIYDGVTGTNHYEVAEYWSKCVDAVVIDTATGMQMSAFFEGESKVKPIIEELQRGDN